MLAAFLYIEKIAEIKGVKLGQVADKTTENAFDIFNLNSYKNDIN